MSISATRGLGWLLTVLLIGMGWGCASTQETATLQQSISMLHERTNALDRKIQSTEGQGQRSADLYAKLEELQMRVGALNGRVEELQHRLEQMQRAPSGQSPESAVQLPPPSSTPQVPPLVASPPLAARPSATTEPKVAVPEREDQEKVQFDKAAQFMQKGQYENARKEFQGFLSRYPKAAMADNAQFSIGECYYSEKRYQEAIESYQKVLDQYPSGNKVPHALLKQGSAFQALGDVTAAHIIYERLVEKYPGTPQAQAAEKKLKQLP